MNYLCQMTFFDNCSHLFAHLIFDFNRFDFNIELCWTNPKNFHYIQNPKFLLILNNFVKSVLLSKYTNYIILDYHLHCIKEFNGEYLLCQVPARISNLPLRFIYYIHRIRSFQILHRLMKILKDFNILNHFIFHVIISLIIKINHSIQINLTI